MTDDKSYDEGKVEIISHLLITDGETGEILVNQRDTQVDLSTLRKNHKRETNAGDESKN